MRNVKHLLTIGSAVVGTLCLSASAMALPVGWTCTGNCGSSGADGVVTAPPIGGAYDWVSTDNGVQTLPHLNLGGETTGSLLQSNTFSAAAGDQLAFYFNYVTTDGAGFADYAWAELLDAALTPVALLFTARTTTGDNTVPGFGMPANAATLVPAATPIIPGGPSWSPLGPDSGACFDEGCGYTGWIQSLYTVAAAGTFVLRFGVVNWDDDFFQSGLAIAGATIGDVPIGPPGPPPVVSEPSLLILLGAGLGLAARRRCAR